MPSRLSQIAASRTRAPNKARTQMRLAVRRFRRAGRPLPRLPSGLLPSLEAPYVLTLRRLTRGWIKEVRKATERVLRSLPVDARADAEDSTFGRLREELRTKARGQGRRAARAAFGLAEEKSRAAANAQVSAATGGIRLWRGVSPEVQAVMDRALERNVRLVSSIPVQLLDQVESTVREGIAAGTHVDGLRRALEERFSVAESRAELIARDQIGKLQGQLAEGRARELGVDTYVWRVSGGPRGDGRVRPMHLELDGSKQRFSDPPVTNSDGDRNNPGEDFQCRCNAEPDAEALLDSLLGVEPTEPPEPAEVTPAPATPSSRLADALRQQSALNLTPEQQQAVAGLADSDLNYLRSGMRSLETHTSAYRGATEAEVDAIAAGLLPTKTGRAFEPIRLASDLNVEPFILEDGRHRLAAARAAGARVIAADVDGQHLIIPLPELDRKPPLPTAGSVAPIPQRPPVAERRKGVSAANFGPVTKSVFGRPLVESDLDQLFGLHTAVLPPGYKTEFTQMVEIARTGAVRAAMAILDAAGNAVGSVSRRYAKGADGKVHVEHSLFFLDSNIQGGGIGRQIFNAQIDAYVARGDISQVELIAADVGKYAWTKAGFEWTDPSDLVKVRGELTEELSRRFGPEPAAKLMSQVHTPTDIQELSVNGERVGKDLLIRREGLIEMSQVPGKIKRL